MVNRVAVIGAGVSGLACAGVLDGAGVEVRVFDKGRGPGGRVATRRRGSDRFDHGAQYFTVRTRAFRSRVEAWCAAGIVAPWRGSIVVLDRGRTRPPRGEVERFVGVPGMSALGHALAEGLPVALSTRIRHLRGSAGAWILEHEGGAEGPFDAVVLALPPAQAATLAPSLAARLAPATLHPCWAALLVHAEPLPLEFDGAFVESGPLSWIARDGSKPGRPAGERWVIHASPEWSAANLEKDPATVASALAEALAEAAGRPLPEPVSRDAHRWRYALPRTPLGVPFVSGENGLAACGDWCDGPRVEGAWQSGRALGAALLRGLRDPA